MMDLVCANEKTNTPPLESSPQKARKILKAILLAYLHELFLQLFKHGIQVNNDQFSMESYSMDSKIMELLLSGITETGEYTLEGIAYHTGIPLDIICEAAFGINKQFSVTPWARVAGLYLQVKPDIAKLLLDKLIELKSKNPGAFSRLLSED